MGIMPFSTPVTNQAMLQQAIDDITNNTPATILVGNGFNLSSTVTIPADRNITITSQGAAQYVITVTSDIRHFQVDGTLRLENIEIVGRLADTNPVPLGQNGGGIQVGGGAAEQGEKGQ